MGLAIPMLQLNSDFIGPQEETGMPDPTTEIAPISAADNILRQKLLELMDSGYHQESGLTILILAEKLNCPEHQLRRLINGHLGYRNFRHSSIVTESRPRGHNCVTQRASERRY